MISAYDQWVTTEPPESPAACPECGATGEIVSEDEGPVTAHDEDGTAWCEWSATLRCPECASEWHIKDLVEARDG
ncbi:MAG: hypothetical protein ACYCZN_01775 [Candidatus Dormibacteria bacterium]